MKHDIEKQWTDKFLAKRNPTLARDDVQKNWGDNAPEWVKVLAKYCDDNSQKKAATIINKSLTTVNLVLKNKYNANTTTIQASVEATLMRQCVACPVLGEIEGSECLKHQTAPFNSANHVAVSLFRACRTCPFNTIGVKHNDQR